MKKLCAIAVLCALSACGGSGGYDDGGTTTPPPPPAPSVDAFFTRVLSLIGMAPDNAEPVAVEDAATTTPDDSEPVAVN